MLNLNKLNTSLTKHGAHKIAQLLQKYGKDEALSHFVDSEPGINIDHVQAHKNLSVDARGKVPELWDKARALGQPAINALVLIAIIFSHRDLLKAMARARSGSLQGTIKRDDHLDGKAFTNFAHILEELGFATSHTPNVVKYDLTPLLRIRGLPGPAAQLFALKLKTAGWNGSGVIAEQLIANHLNDALSMSEAQLRHWLGKREAEAPALLLDADFFSGEDETPENEAFVFQPGHNPKKTGTIDVSVSKKLKKAVLRHNQLQTALYEALVRKHGKNCVSSENRTGQGTAIDIVTKVGEFYDFYEIKIATSVRACIRQAIPQLLEYAYWRDDRKITRKLIIIGEFPMTAAAEEYLGYLRDRFDIQLYYEMFTINATS